MTVGVLWEFFEFTADQVMNTHMHRHIQAVRVERLGQCRNLGQLTSITSSSIDKGTELLDTTRCV